MRRCIIVLLLLLSPVSPVWAASASSRSFDGVNDEVDWGNVVNVTTGDMSYCAWTNMTETAAQDVVLAKKGSFPNTAAGYALRQNSTDAASCEVSDGTTQQLAAGTTDTDGAWHFSCCTWDSTGDDLTTYVDGVSEGSDTVGTVGSLTNASNLQSGEFNDNTGDASGLIAYASIYSGSVLTVVEIAELQWKPEGIGSYSFMAPLVGDNPEIEWAAKTSGTVSGTDTSSVNGPPVLFGLGLPL